MATAAPVFRLCRTIASRTSRQLSIHNRHIAQSPYLQHHNITYPRFAVLRRPFSASCAVREKKYTQDHEWVELSEDGTTGTIGITTYAAKALGDVVYVELPTLSSTITAGDAIGAVESVKSASDIMSPVTGEVVEANSKLEETPGLINKDPEGDGWIARVKVEEGGGKELEGLMGKEKYDEFTEE